MDKKYCPDHIQDYVKEIEENSIFASYDWTRPDHGYSYELECSCGSKEFNIYVNENKRTIAQCHTCDKKIIVYDLTLYPATGVDGEIDDCEMRLYHLEDGVNLFRICVYYEYPDPDPDFVDDEEEEITGNSVSWCVIWLYNSRKGDVFEFINDETT